MAETGLNNVPKNWDSKLLVAPNAVTKRNGDNHNCDGHSNLSPIAGTARPTNTSVLYCIKYQPTYAIDFDDDTTAEPALTETEKLEMIEFILASKVVSSSITEIESEV